MKKRKFVVVFIVLVVVFVVVQIFGCGRQMTFSNNRQLTLTLQADFSKPGVRASSVRSLAVYPEVFITPDSYLIALKSAVLTIKGTTEVVELFNYSLLDSSLIEKFSSNEVKEVTITSKDLAPLDYEFLKIEVYWVQERFPIKSGTSETAPAKLETPAMKNIRIYFTDDKAVESSRNVSSNTEHHQGDLTIIGTDETTELGWFFPPADFSGQKPRPGSPDTDGYAANLNLDKGDPITGHDRGPFGDNEFWGGRLATGEITGTHPENIYTEVITTVPTLKG